MRKMFSHNAEGSKLEETMSLTQMIQAERWDRKKKWHVPYYFFPNSVTTTALLKKQSHSSKVGKEISKCQKNLSRNDSKVLT